MAEMVRVNQVEWVVEAELRMEAVKSQIDVQ
jgi:hypothetical protein